MGKLSIYGLEASPPTRSCLLALKALDLSYELIPVNLLSGEHLSPEYREKNPQHTVPMLEDDEFRLCDSHAIMAYLVGKYAENDSLYPQDIHKRALVDQRLHYDSSILFMGTVRLITKSLLYMGATTIERFKIDAVIEVYDTVECFLGDNDYIAGSELTIADFSFLTSICSLLVYYDLDPVKHSKITAWLERMQQLPYHDEANGVGAAQFEALVKSKNFTIETD